MTRGVSCISQGFKEPTAKQNHLCFRLACKIPSYLNPENVSILPLDSFRAVSKSDGGRRSGSEKGAGGHRGQ
jgi:hypothetical protein